MENIEQYIQFAGFLGYTIPLVFALGVLYSSLRNKDETISEKIVTISNRQENHETRLNRTEQNVAGIMEGFEGIKESLARIESGLYKHIDNHK